MCSSDLLEAGVHFGHRTGRWNSKMRPFIFGERNGVHIIDLQQTVPMLDRALKAVRDVTAAGGRVLFVGTKRAAADYVADAAKRCGQYYVNHRWLGGMLTNFRTISQSIKRLRELEERIVSDQSVITKKELLTLTRERDKLERALGGIHVSWTRAMTDTWLSHAEMNAQMLTDPYDVVIVHDPQPLAIRSYVPEDTAKWVMD